MQLVAHQVLTMALQFENYLPNEYGKLVEAVDMLPGASHSQFTPMTSLIININVQTEAH